MRVTIWSVQPIMAILYCMALIACSTTPPTNEPTPNIPNWGSTPTSNEPSLFFPSSLNCLQITETGIGTTWRGLTIGESTLADVQDEFGMTGWWDTFQGNLTFWDGDINIETCFFGTVLNALNTYSPNDLPNRLEEWLLQFGEPDYVTWSRDYYSRSLVWASEGILVVMDVETEQTINVILFSSMSKRNLMSSWVADELPKEKTEFYSDADLNPLPAEKDVEDPWGFND